MLSCSRAWRLVALPRLAFAVCLTLLAGCLLAPPLGGAPPVSRIRSYIDDTDRVAISGNTRPAIERGVVRDLGALPASRVLPHMMLHFRMTDAQRADLDQLLKAQQDRRSPLYHRFLTPEEYAARFGLGGADVGKVVEWLEDSGFSDVQVARSKAWVSFAGTAAQAESAFHVSLRRYINSRGEMHFANSSNPQLPSALESVVDNVRGLHNFAMKPLLRRARPRFTQAGNHYIAPDDWTTIYDVKPLYTAGIDGTGVSIAVVGQSNISLSDVQAFRSAAGLPANTPSVVIPTGDRNPGIQSSTGDEVEADLDVEWAGAIARNAHILLVTASATYGNGVQDALTYAIDQNVAPIVSTSYGICEADEPSADFKTMESLFQQANAQGMTVVAASGDNGSADCDTSDPATHGLAVDYPASSAYVTGMGGSQIEDGSSTYWNSTNDGTGGSALSYIPESAWNDNAHGSGATGGGASKLVQKPAWQTGEGVPSDGVRDVPDLAFTASPRLNPLLICSEGSCTDGFLDAGSNPNAVGGTSAGSPTFAGVLALVIQSHGANTRLGNINPNLYSLAQIQSDVLHDITTGTNAITCGYQTPDCVNAILSGFNAGPGYDQATGWGSIDAYNFAEQWFGDIQVSASPTSLTIQPGSAATATIAVNPQNNFSGPVTLSCSVPSTLVDVTCSVPSTPINTSGTATVTISAATTARVPFWPRLRISLPPSEKVMLTGLGAIALCLACICFFWQRRRVSSHGAYAYGIASVAIIAITAGTVACGGGSGGGDSTSGHALSLSCNLPGNAVAGIQYSGTCTATGGFGALTFGISGGTLPPGIGINIGTGAIAGIPDLVGTVSFTVQVTDSSLPPQTATYTENSFTTKAFVPPLSISCILPTDASTGHPYSGACSASGGTPPIKYSIGSGALPPGLTMDGSTGDIAGTPTTVGISSFTVEATDSSSPPQTAKQNVTNFPVVVGVLQLSCWSTFTGSVRKPFTMSCPAIGGTPPYTYSITAGTPPAGLDFDPSTATTSGIPTQAADAYHPFTLTVTDSGSPVQTATENIYIIILPVTPLAVSCPPSLAAASLGTAYMGSCSTSGGNTPLTASISSGQLPPGLSIDPASMQIAGTPTLMGTYSFTIHVADGSVPPQTADSPTSITVGPRPPETAPVTITATSGGIATSTTVMVTVP